MATVSMRDMLKGHIAVAKDELHVRVELAVVVPVVVALISVVVVRVVVPGVLLGRLGLDVGVGQRLEQGSDLEDRRAVSLGAVEGNLQA